VVLDFYEGPLIPVLYSSSSLRRTSGSSSLKNKIMVPAHKKNATPGGSGLVLEKNFKFKF
jgi:hypothetical protein